MPKESTSKQVASLAGKYLNFKAAWAALHPVQTRNDVRALAASCLTQREDNPKSKDSLIEHYKEELDKYKIALRTLRRAEFGDDVMDARHMCKQYRVIIERLAKTMKVYADLPPGLPHSPTDARECIEYTRKFLKELIESNGGDEWNI